MLLSLIIRMVEIRQVAESLDDSERVGAGRLMVFGLPVCSPLRRRSASADSCTAEMTWGDELPPRTHPRIGRRSLAHSRGGTWRWKTIPNSGFQTSILDSWFDKIGRPNWPHIKSVGHCAKEILARRSHGMLTQNCFAGCRVQSTPPLQQESPLWKLHTNRTSTKHSR